MAAISSTNRLPASTLSTPSSSSGASSSSSAMASSETSVELHTLSLLKETRATKERLENNVKDLSAQKNALEEAQNALKKVSKKISPISLQLSQIEKSLNEIEAAEKKLDSLKSHRDATVRGSLTSKLIECLVEQMPELLSKRTEDQNTKATLIGQRDLLETQRNSLKDRVKNLTEQVNRTEKEISSLSEVVKFYENIENVMNSSSEVLLTISDRDERKRSLDKDEKKEVSKRGRGQDAISSHSKKARVLKVDCPVFKEYISRFPKAREYFTGREKNSTMYKVTVTTNSREVTFEMPKDATPELRMLLVHNALNENKIRLWIKYAKAFTNIKNIKDIFSQLRRKQKRGTFFIENGKRYEIRPPLPKGPDGALRTKKINAQNYNRFIEDKDNNTKLGCDELIKQMHKLDWYKTRKLKSVGACLTQVLDEAVQNEGFVNKGIKKYGIKLLESQALKERREALARRAA